MANLVREPVSSASSYRTVERFLATPNDTLARETSVSILGVNNAKRNMAAQGAAQSVSCADLLRECMERRVDNAVIDLGCNGGGWTSNLAVIARGRVNRSSEHSTHILITELLLKEPSAIIRYIDTAQHFHKVRVDLLRSCCGHYPCEHETSNIAFENASRRLMVSACCSVESLYKQLCELRFDAGVQPADVLILNCIEEFALPASICLAPAYSAPHTKAMAARFDRMLREIATVRDCAVICVTR